MRNLCGHARLFPIAALVLLFASMLITYSTAVSLNHVYPYWPYISDTGTVPPESCIFSLLLNLQSVLGLAVIYIRYRMVSEYVKQMPYVGIRRGWNVAATALGYASCFGLALVANFQETNALFVHLAGALACFAGGNVFFLLQTIFTYRIDRGPSLLFWTRAVLTFLNAVFFVMTFAPIKGALDNFKGKNMLLWTPRDGGYDYHVVSTVSEWFMAVALNLFVFSFHWDFRRINVKSPEVSFFDAAPSELENCSDNKPPSGISQWV